MCVLGGRGEQGDGDGGRRGGGDSDANLAPELTAEPLLMFATSGPRKLHHWFNLPGRAASDHNAQRKLAASALERPALPLDFAGSVENEKGEVKIKKEKKKLKKTHPCYAVCGLHTTVKKKKKLRHQHKDKTLCLC